MRTRPLKDSDVPVLRQMYEASGFGYQFPNFDSGMFEAVVVVADDNDQPIMAAAAERIVQLYLLRGEIAHPAAALHAIRLLHEALRPALKEKGYREAEAFLPPAIAKSFGRRLMRSFGWLKNWPSYCVRV
jgi:hypothetical protein